MRHHRIRTRLMLTLALITSVTLGMTTLPSALSDIELTRDQMVRDN